MLSPPAEAPSVTEEPSQKIVFPFRGLLSTSGVCATEYRSVLPFTVTVTESIRRVPMQLILTALVLGPMIGFSISHATSSRTLPSDMCASIRRPVGSKVSPES